MCYAQIIPVSGQLATGDLADIIVDWIAGTATLGDLVQAMIEWKIQVTTECSDGTDNDGDGDTDLADGGCDDAADDDESDCGDGECEGGEDCDSCPGDCPTENGEVCCSGSIFTGDCCDSSECARDCVNHECASTIPTIAETITLCDSWCDSSSNSEQDAYCSDTRVIIVDSREVTGTCRAFSRKHNVPGFNKCQEYCKDYPESTARCIVGTQTDSDCDGVP